MRILAHPDASVLEAYLLRRLAEEHPPAGEPRSLVLVPTSRLASHFERRLATASARSAWLGVEVLTFHAVVRAIQEQAGPTSAQVASRRIREVLVERLLQDTPEAPWSRAVRERPGFLAPLAGALDELREAGIEPHELAACCNRDSPTEEALADLYARYSARLAAGRDAAWVDEPGLVRTALPHAAAFAARLGRVWVHGAYEWIGVHVELLHALAATAPLTVLLPVAATGQAGRYAREFARRHLLEPGESVSALPSDDPAGCGLELGALFEEDSRPRPADPGRIEFRHAQGAASEVAVAGLEALAAARDGCPAHEIALVARSLAPYGPALEAFFEDRGVPWTSSLAATLRRQPLVRDFLQLLEIVDRDFPRRATAEWLRSPRIRWAAFGLARGRPRGDSAERWSRRAGIVGGLEEWSEVLPAWAEQPPRGFDAEPDAPANRERSRARRDEAERIVAALRALRERVSVAPRTWGEHGRALHRLLDGLFLPPEAPTETRALEALHGLLDELERIDPVVGGLGAVSFGEVRRWLEDACASEEFAPWPADGPGIRVLDALQFRGLTFRRVFLLGMNAGLFPRGPREDPIVGDELRLRLRRRTGRALPVAAEGRDEERVLLSMILGGSRERLDVSWQRADETGRARSVSLALRELARLALGRPDLRAVREGRDGVTTSIPFHPTRWLEHLAGRVGLFSVHEEMLLAALHAAVERDVTDLESRFAVLAPGLGMIRATQAFDIVDPRFDARLDAPRAVRRFSVSALERLGRCPLQYFFRDVLGVHELDAEAAATEPARQELGALAHELLQRLYSTLEFGRGSPEEVAERAAAWLEAERDRIFAGLGRRMGRRMPLLWELTRDSWIAALGEFVRVDLLRLGAGDWRPAGFELPSRTELDLGDGAAVEIEGRFDRVFARGEATLVGDYKTSGDLADRAREISMLRGRRLQVPLYWLLAGAGSTVEILGVGPLYDPLDEERSRAVFRGFGGAAARESFLETLRGLVGLARRGRFPLHRDRHCTWCAYRDACRRNHPPTLEREQQDPDGRAFAELQSKSAPTRRRGAR